MDSLGEVVILVLIHTAKLRSYPQGSCGPALLAARALGGKWVSVTEVILMCS